ncbi:hypothetical protein LM595_01095 [Candidatus Acetothermia bacterium]|nr:hypothetical protein [Candidatus Acetothermia bacterium]
MMHPQMAARIRLACANRTDRRKEKELGILLFPVIASLTPRIARSFGSHRSS